MLPNDSNPLGYILGGTVMHLIDITGAIACHRHTNALALTAGVDSLEFLHPIRVGDMIILKSRVTVHVQDVARSGSRGVFGGRSRRGERRLTSRAYLTFVSLDEHGRPKAGAAAGMSRGPRTSERCRRGPRPTRRAPGAKARSGCRLPRQPLLAPLTADSLDPCSDSVAARRHPHLAALEIERDAVRAQELVADDAADLEAEQHAGRAQVEHDDREVVVGDVVELQVDARQQERVAVPARRAVDLQRDLARAASR